MADPTFAGIVKMTSVTLPVAGTISTYTPLLGVDGVIGVKSGFTTAAGGCDVVAVMREVHGRSVLDTRCGDRSGRSERAGDGRGHGARPGQWGRRLHRLEPAGPRRARSWPTSAWPVTRLPHGPARRPTFLSWPGVTAERLLVATGPVRAGADKGTRIGSVVVVSASNET